MTIAPNTQSREHMSGFVTDWPGSEPNGYCMRDQNKMGHENQGKRYYARQPAVCPAERCGNTRLTWQNRYKLTCSSAENGIRHRFCT